MRGLQIQKNRERIYRSTAGGSFNVGKKRPRAMHEKEQQRPGDDYNTKGFKVVLMDAVQREKARAILKHYGEKPQRRQLVEECSELIQAVCKYDRELNAEKYNAEKVGNLEREIAGEIADVLIMIEQLKIAMFCGDGVGMIDSYIEYKLNRQLERIKEENKRG